LFLFVFGQYELNFTFETILGNSAPPT